MKFNYETQGASTYLVCELEPTEQLDSLTLGMLTNNHIPGLAPVIHTEMNGQRFLKYNISAKVASNQFFGGSMNKQRALTTFKNILDALCSADEYMIEQNCFSVIPEHVYLNVSNCESALICIPVSSNKNINTEVAALFKQILFTTQFDASEDVCFITEMITYLNNGATFSVYGFRDLVVKLQSTNGDVQSPVQNNAISSQATPAMSAPVMQTPMAPVSSFDSTITIDDMPGLIAQKQQPQVMQQSQSVTPVQQQPSVPQQPQISPQKPVVQTPQVSIPKPVVAPASQSKPPVVPASRPANGGMPPVAIPKPSVQTGPGFAIPGQPSSVAKPSVPQESKKEKANKKDDGEKKMSFFGLLANYNKENAALYKAQKEAAKKAKAEQVKSVSPVVPENKKVQQPVINQPSMSSVPNQQPIVQQQYQPPVQPVPVQSSFNETTVLSSFSGETTVLSANPGIVEPYLIRVKTGERISLNKPVFRIGKEKSYVDYFIADNTAISRSHCNIHTENGEYFIEDTNSTNHTYVNGKIINSNIKTKLTNGDKIRLANEDFVFSL